LEEMVAPWRRWWRFGQNPARSHQIEQDLSRSSEISLDLARSHQIRSDLARSGKISPNLVSSHQIWQPNSTYARLTNADLHTVFSTFAAHVSFVRSSLNLDNFLGKNPAGCSDLRVWLGEGEIDGLELWWCEIECFEAAVWARERVTAREEQSRERGRWDFEKWEVESEKWEPGGEARGEATQLRTEGVSREERHCGEREREKWDSDKREWEERETRFEDF
jgi:hypothetical protein